MAVRKTTTSSEDGAIHVVTLKIDDLHCYIRGTSPLIFNQMAAKAKRELLLPSGRKTQAAREQSLKHDPIQEYRASVYRHVGDSAPTRLKFPSPGFKALLGTAALEVPGAKKTQIGRLTWIHGMYIDIYGIPELFMTTVRSADINRTPDIRTRAVVTNWCCRVSLSYTRPTLNAQTVATLLAAGGLICGVGDFRQERGAGSHGQFALVEQDDAEFAHIVKHGGREAQDAALQTPGFYDEDSAELYAWYMNEVQLRGKKVA